ncbi:hypothetical protein H257_11106 [Aphanomyces astaci]|uniref:DDE Tnp4 domain-containing protein n=1 Tax=Aphanomyces astaci TaxID=112090 RepID=W4G4E3_APHAT|nr:hypothetical protein H257_11106 [Aphanomyces astaci]ETV74141.1 hypothetical protein H257_11106 [Aphanomyces astaci]|eukprot:XP_009836247.1 hypothetical protein H257_11106 [Aphanomyces astaci]
MDGAFGAADVERNRRVSSDRVVVENFFDRVCSLWKVSYATFTWGEKIYGVIQRTTFAKAGRVSAPLSHESPESYCHGPICSLHASFEIEVLLKKRRTSKFRQRLRLLRLLACVVERPIIPNVRFALQTITDADSRLKFRFDVAGVQRLVVALRMPEVVVISSRDRCLASEALCITLYRMSYPRRYYDMMATFGRSRESICRIFNDVIDFLFDKWKELLYFCD